MTSDGKPGDREPRSKGIYIYWGIALSLLAALGLFCWLAVVPVWRVHRAMLALAEKGMSHEQVIARLGGQAAALQGLALYVRLPESLATHRFLAAFVLQEEGASAVPVIMRLLRDRNANMRRQAATALGMIGDDRAIGPLLAASDDEEPSVRRAVAEALGRMGSGARRAALKLMGMMLADSDPAVRDCAFFAVYRVTGHENIFPSWTISGVSADLPTLLEKLIHDEDPAVRRAAAEALKKIKKAQERDQ